MPFAAIAAQSRQADMNRLDPMGSFAAGAQIRATLQRLDLAEQAARREDIFSMAKIGLEREELQQKRALTQEQLKIAQYNAVTNRMNASRTAQKLTAGSGVNIFSALKTDENGEVYLDPTALADQGSGGAPTVAPQEYPGPTTGEGDGYEVAPLSPGGTGIPRTLPDSATGGLPLPQGGATASAGTPGVESLLPPPQGAAAPAGPAYASGTGGQAAPATTPHPNRLYLGRIGVNAKGQPTMSFEPKKPGDSPPPLPDPAFLQALNKRYEHLGMMAVPDAENKSGYTFIQRPSLKGEDFSISSLDAETKKTYLEDVNSMIADAAEIENPSDAEKMRSAGVKFKGATPTRDEMEAGYVQMQKEGKDWNAAYNNVKKDKENALMAKATTYAKKLNGAFAGKPGFVPRNGLDVLRDIGLSSAEQTPNSPTAAPAGRGNVATVNPTAPAGAPPPTPPQPAKKTAGTSTTGRSPVAGSPSPAAPISSNDQPRIDFLEKEIATEQDPKIKSQKEAFLSALRQRQPATVPSSASRGPQEETDAYKMPALPEPAAPQADTSKTDTAKRQWEEAKQKVFRTAVSTLTPKKLDDLLNDDPTAFETDVPTSLRGKTRIQKQHEWVKENADRLGLKSRDGKPLTLESVVFIQENDGRAIKLKEIIRAAFKDKRYEEWVRGQRPSTGEAPTGRKFEAVPVKIGKAVKTE